MTLVARVREDPTALAPAIRRIVRELDPQLAITDLRPMADVQAASLARQRFLMTLLSAFAVIGLLLAVVGVYGVVAQVVRARRREMAVRLALGARASALQWLVVRYGLSLALAGLVLGIGAAVLVTRWMAAMLYEVAPTDPLTIGGVSFALLGAAFVACWLPGRRATRVDPLVELREE
jgi:ABC-type antimicrobial peptide transport system permease subunit